MSDEKATPRSRGLRMPVIEASHVQNVHTIWDNSWFGLGHRPRPLSSSESVLVIHARNVRTTCPPSCAHSILPSLEAPRHRDVPRYSQALCDATSTKWAQDPVSASLLFAYLLSHTSSRDNTQRCSAIHRASPLSWSLSLSLSLSSFPPAVVLIAILLTRNAISSHARKPSFFYGYLHAKLPPLSGTSSIALHAADVREKESPVHVALSGRVHDGRLRRRQGRRVRAR